VVRTILVIATAGLGAVLFGSAAQACISCEYVPEVVKGSQTTEPRTESRAPVRERERAYAPERREREPTRAAKRSRPEPEEEKVDTAARAPAAKDKDADSENSSIAAIAKAFDAPTTTAKADAKASDNENSSVAVVSELATTAIAKADVKKADSENSSIAGVVVEERKIERAENSSISVASITPSESAAATEPAKPVAAKAADCKKFVSSVGMIVSVPCD
jgi:hypothetical protein